MNEIKNKEELKNSLEELRAQKYPSIPADLLAKVLDELSISGDSSKTLENINTILKDYLK